MTGWIALHRQIRSHWLWHDPIKLKWWLDIILSANHDDNKVLIKGVLLEVKRGQCAKSLETWAKEWRTTKATVKRFMETLKKESMIDSKSVTVTTLITVCKYDSYNNPRYADSTADDTQTVPHAKRTQPPNNKGNNDNNVKEVVLPFDSENFATAWDEWKDYKKKQHKFQYKTSTSEQQGVNLLQRESNKDEATAIEMLHYAMAKGYKGWVPADDVNFYPSHVKPQQPKQLVL